MRVQDIDFNQSFIQRVLGLGKVHVESSDKDVPVIDIGPIEGARDLYKVVEEYSIVDQP